MERHCSSYLNNKKYLKQIVPLKSVLNFQLLKIQSDCCISIFITAHLLESLCIYFLRTFSCPGFGPSSQAHGDFGKKYTYGFLPWCVSQLLLLMPRKNPVKETTFKITQEFVYLGSCHTQASFFSSSHDKPMRSQDLFQISEF